MHFGKMKTPPSFSLWSITKMTREKISLTNIFLRDAVYNIYVYDKVYTVKVPMIRYEFGCAAVPCPTCSSPRRPLPQNTC